MRILELDKERKWQGFRLTQLKRDGNIAMYGKYNGDLLVSIEVIKIRIKPINDFIRNDKNKDYDAFEAYPSSEEFGRYGWDFCGKSKTERSEEKYQDLIKGEKTQ